MKSSRFRHFDTDLGDLYETDPRDVDGNGDSLGMRLVAVGLKGSYRATENYDEHSSEAGSVKEENIQTADRWRDSSTQEFKSGQVLRMRCGDGAIRFGSVRGSPKIRTRLYRRTIFITPTNEPLISPYSATYLMFNPTFPFVFQFKVAAAGAAVPFSAVGQPLNSGIKVSCPSSNQGPIVVGGPEVTDVVDGTGNGKIIYPGDKDIAISGNDASWLYFAGTHVGDVISGSGF